MDVKSKVILTRKPGDIMKYKKWITCTPVAFPGDEKTFFSRDSGLCCRALQALGANAKVVLPEPARDDEPDVLRVPYARLSDPGFWREQHVEAVILYSWADPKYTAIAEAIKAGGVKLYLNMDTGGLFSPFFEPAAYVRVVWAVQRQKHGMLGGGLVAFCQLGWQCIGLHQHFSRLRHMAAADAIGVVSLIAAERVRKYARFFGRKDIAQKVHFVSHPIDSTMRYSGEPKQETVIAVGRWDDCCQKRPEMLIDVAVRVLNLDLEVRFVIVGKDAVRCAAEIAARIPFAQERVVGHERLEHDQLCEEMNRAKISLCTSRYESFHIASGEALLCGCSIVAPQSPCLPSLPYFIDGCRSGQLSEDNPDALADAVLAELNVWKARERDPVQIAQIWRERIASDAVVREIDKLIS